MNYTKCLIGRIISKVSLDRLIERGSFPEPFLAKSSVDANRWRLQYIDGLIRADSLNFEKIHDFKTIQLLLELLRLRVGSPISYASLARDLACSENTVKRYIEVFEVLMIVFKVTPYHKNIGRSLLKESKVYFFDNGLVRGDNGIKFENFVAISLLKYQQAVEDYQGIRTKLSYIRTKDKKEIDFALVVDNEIDRVIKVKLSSVKLSPSLPIVALFSEKISIS
jgi:predicted AAA+ superfamily ATPase